MYNFGKTMSTTMMTLLLMLALPLLAVAADAPAPPAQIAMPTMAAPAPANLPGLTGDFQLRYEQQWNASGFMQRLVTLLTSPEWGGSSPELKPFIDMLQQSGKLNFAGCQEALTIDQNLVHYTAATHYAGLTPDQFKGKLFALPNKPLASAQYVTDDALLYVGLNNVPQTALLVFHEIASHPEMLKQGPLAELLGDAIEEMGGGDFSLEDLPQVEAMIQGFGLEAQINQLLTGEVGLAFYGADWAKLMQGNEPQPTNFKVAVFLGLKDGAKAAGMLSAYGSDIGLTAGGTDGQWTSYSIKDAPFVNIAIGPNMLIASLGGAGMPAAGAATLATPECQYYVKLNLDRLVHEVLEPAIGPEIANEFDLDEMAQQCAGKMCFTPQQLDVAWGYLLDIEHTGSNLGSVVLTGRYADGYQADVTMRPDVFMYTLYNVGRIAGAGMMQEHLSHLDNDMEDDDSGEDADGPGDMDESGADHESPGE
jgi:hypothetical protein